MIIKIYFLDQALQKISILFSGMPKNVGMSFTEYQVQETWFSSNDIILVTIF